MRTFSNIKHRHAIRLNIGDIKLKLEAKATISSTIKENQLLYFRNFLPFAIAFIINIFYYKKKLTRFLEKTAFLGKNKNFSKVVV